MPIVLKKVRVHNLKEVSISIDANELIVCTGVSGSGKSSLAFDTIYTEGQRRYVESLSHFARRQMGDLNKPELESATGISPTISIEQKAAGKNPRSTVGTMTQVYDYLRVLFARIGVPHCPVSGEEVKPQSRERVIKTVQHYPDGAKLIVLAPYAREKKAEFKEDFQELLKKGYMRVRVDGEFLSLEEPIRLDGALPHDVDVVIDRLSVAKENQSRIAEAVTAALQFGNGVMSVWDGEEERLFSMHAYSPKSGLSYGPLEPHDFSFNSPFGMCLTCQGLGYIDDFKLDKILDPKKSIAGDCCEIATSYQTVRYFNIYNNLFGERVNTPWKKLTEEEQGLFLYGSKEDKWIKMHFVHPHKGFTWVDRIKWKGVLHEARVRFQEAKSEKYRKKMGEIMEQRTCPDCQGSRLRPYPSRATLGGKTIQELSAMTIADSHHFFHNLELSSGELLIGQELLKEIQERLHFLIEVGLHYLTLDRTAPTLSGGEAQRVRLASQIGCGLVGITYVLDEPSIGLHPRDNAKLIQTLKFLRDMGNTVLVVEHDEETILAADSVIDFGPGAGAQGGEILVHGSLPELLRNKKSITGQFLVGEEKISIPKKRRKKKKGAIEILGAEHNNLKKIDVSIPLEIFTCITGVSGSGKSSLISDILMPALSNALHQGEQPVGKHKGLKGLGNIDKVIGIDQSPIGRNPRSNPATYIKLFDEIRALFEQLPESMARGYKRGRFSFNVKDGACTECQGMGMVKVDMDFLEDAWVLCSLCEGKRFNSETLTVRYKGKNIYEVLEMDVAEAYEFFENIPSIKHKLEVLLRVGLSYIKLGQFSTTLSGGEAQRIKLAKELVRPDTGKTLYILDEPTTGLHFRDIRHLLDVLHELVDKGNSVLVIEHNMDVVKTADWIIDIGPEGGYRGGKIVAEGPPEKIAEMDTPTGKAVREQLEGVLVQQAQKMLREKKTKKGKAKGIQEIFVTGAEQNNLKHVEATIPRGKITICTGPSGSGKSSFAFDTIYAEGQRRYIESLSPYARQFVKQMPKPVLSHIEGLSPAIAIEQKAHAGNPRSTVGTQTEIYDYLRVLFARIGVPHCPETGEVIQAISKELVVEKTLEVPEGEKLIILAPFEVKRGEKLREHLEKFAGLGYLRVRLDGNYYTLDDLEGIPQEMKKKHSHYLVIDRLVASPSIRKRLFESVETAAEIGKNHLVIEIGGKDRAYNLSFSVESTGKSYPEITPHTFAFNTPEGMCPQCEGLGFLWGANLTQDPKILENSFLNLMRTLWGSYCTEQAYEFLFAILDAHRIDPLAPMKELSPKHLDLLMNGTGEKGIQTKAGFLLHWIGLNEVLQRAARSHDAELRKGVILLLDQIECFACKGARVNPLARAVTIGDKAIHNICQMPLEKALEWAQGIDKKPFLEEVHAQIEKRLHFLVDVGLGYMALDRSAPTLSGGEAQRIRLARQLGSALTGTLYVLDEPTIGLHPSDSDKLNDALLKLKELGNTLLLVEHDPLTLRIADYILDFGPGAGSQGGHITARGTREEILANPASLTGQYLSGKRKISVPNKRKKTDQFLSIQKGTLHNLKSVSAEIPIGLLTVVTGVSGSGKSSLVHGILQPAVQKGILSGEDVLGGVAGISQFDKLITIDQNPIGSTVRANVGTYTEVLDRIRDFFAQIPEAKAKGMQPRHFSYNHRKGMCTGCWGLGYKKVEMHFMPPVRVPCSDCQGMRLNPLSLTVRYKERNFGEYLDTTVQEAREVFQDHPRIVRILDTLIEVGLGYLKLGQEMQTLSGGEAQRIKLSRELAKRSTGKTLYLLDEPTTGLHFEDIEKLLHVLHRLVAKGNTMVIIEHNLEIIKNADWVLDLGPGPGEKGGKIIASGPPDELRKNKKSITGKYLS